ncbi:DUF4097 family beta strand repeat-containing protein [Streptomyces sp. YIM 98790]|uniref:DUF4097 family beta strand repeat-containing protein n=1 Tax=Streptomyces sp. YIM 98790 TaxID=2689077 RepID=UPI00140DEA34|nr:DUF4097 family beta strand repeat-containing protein [Streptomyces sp. YIM 98790]
MTTITGTRTPGTGPGTHVRRSSRTAPRALLAAGAALLLPATVAACTQETHDIDGEERVFGLPGTGELVIEGDNSRIELVVDESLSGEVSVTRWFHAEKLAGSTDISWSMRDDGTLELRTSCEGVVTSCDARHLVAVPAGTAVRATAENGPLAAAGFATALALTTENGAIEIEDSTGPLALETGNGKITGHGLASEEVTTRSDNGSVHLSLVSAPALVDAETDNGSVTIEVPGGTAYDVRTDTGHGDVDVEVEQGDSGHVIAVRTDNGSVTVRPGS